MAALNVQLVLVTKDRRGVLTGEHLGTLGEVFASVGADVGAELVDRTVELAVRAAAAVDAEPDLALAVRPALGSVVFRYVPSPDTPGRSDQVNEAIRLHLLATDQAVVGRTELDGRVQLKLTLLNPTVTDADVAGLVALVARTGARVDRP